MMWHSKVYWCNIVFNPYFLANSWTVAAIWR